MPCSLLQFHIGLQVLRVMFQGKITLQMSKKQPRRQIHGQAKDFSCWYNCPTSHGGTELLCHKFLFFPPLVAFTIAQMKDSGSSTITRHHKRQMSHLLTTNACGNGQCSHKYIYIYVTIVFNTLMKIQSRHIVLSIGSVV